MDEDAIVLKGVSLSYNVDVLDSESKGLIRRKKKIENKVLDSIDLTVKKGEVLGVIGVNGSGKSTLLSIISRILEPDSGTVEISGRVASILELGMGFHPDMTGRENILLKGELYGFSKKEMIQKTEKIIEFSGIRNYIDNPVRTYSSGMKSRLAFSVMINVEADIMVVDEILSTGDMTFQQKAADYFKRTLTSGRTVIYVSHSQSSVESLCTRVIWLDKGKIKADGLPKRVFHTYNDALMNSVDMLRDQADTGFPDAQYRLANCYLVGDRVEQDYEQYLSLLEKASEQGHPQAQVDFARILLQNGSDADRKRAIDYLNVAAIKNNEEASVLLSSIVVESDYRSRCRDLKEFFRVVQEKGNPADVFTYAKFLLQTSSDFKEKVEALHLFEDLVQGFHHPDAAIIVAGMYRDGIGTKRDYGKYIEMLKKAAQYDNPVAMSKLSDIYLEGKIVDQDAGEAFRYALAGAERGLTKSQYRVAGFYLEGIGTEKDFTQQKKWYDIYLESTIVRYHLSALNNIASNPETALSEEKMIQIMKETYDWQVLAALCGWYNHDESGMISEEDFKHFIAILAKGCGKPVAIASRFLKAQNPIPDQKLLFEIQKRQAYLGNADVLYDVFKYSEDKTDEFALLCLKLSSKKKNTVSKNDLDETPESE